MFQNKLFISSTLPYINSNAHIGHCFEFVLTDVIARYYRNKFGAANVRFNTGVDEHGLKVYERAVELGMSPQNYCDKMAKEWEVFCKKLQISYDNFYRTSSEDHELYSLAYFRKLSINDNIYKADYTGLYCKGCESFKNQKDLINGRCEQHPSMILEEISEENHFFKLKRIAPFCVPADILVDNTLRAELDYIIENSQDMSISRSKEKVPWAIEIPGTDKTLYCWAEALCNYFFAAGYHPVFTGTKVETEFNETWNKPFTEFWNNSMIVCGKDNLRFQALILPALLAGIGLPSPKKVLVHGTILDETGTKMSKSEGNVIDPIEQLEKYGVNALRYYLMTGLNTFGNSKYSEEELVNKYNSELADGYGNLVARTLHLIDIKNVEIDDALVTKKQMITEDIQEVSDAFISCNIRYAYQLVSGLVNRANVYISENKPYADDCPNRAEVLNNVYSILKEVSVFYKILMPDLTVQIDQALQEKKKVILFKKLEFESIAEKR